MYKDKMDSNRPEMINTRNNGTIHYAKTEWR